MATLNIDEKVYRTFKKFCEEKHLVMSAVASQAIENWMKANSLLEEK